MMQIKSVFRNFISIGMAVILCCGCGSSANSGNTSPAQEDEIKEITLVEPVGIAANYDEATYRDLYSVTIFSTMVAPMVSEYSFEKDETFQKYGLAPGDVVQVGDALVYSETRAVDKQIEEMKEQLEELEENYKAEVDLLQKDISDAKDVEYKANVSYANMYNFEPDASQEEAYAGWATMALRPEIEYKRAKQARECLEQSLKEKQELYALEKEYKEGAISRLENKIADSTIIAADPGVIVNSVMLYGGDTVEKDAPLIAVGDTSVKVLRTEYITKGTINKAEDVYAIIDGKRYELTYEPMEQEEYNLLTNDGQTVYSTFFIEDPKDEIQMGQFADVVLVKEKRTQVLCVPQDAVKTENDVTYCYVYDGTDSVYTPIQTGMKDGLYIEVLTGLEPGDKVLSSQAVTKGKNTATLSKGECSTEYETGGYLFYPYSEWIVNPVDDGKTYVKEICITDYQYVKAGDVLMRLEVVSDNVEIERCKKRLERLAERLDKLQKIKYDKDARNVIDRETEKAISANLTETRSVQKTLKKLTKYSGIVEVKAPTDGIITDKGYLKEGDLIYSDTKLMQFADVSTSYIVIKDDKAVLAYGNEAMIEYVDASSARQKVAGTIVTVANSSLSKEMAKDWALVSIPKETMQQLGGSTETGEGRWNRNLYTVSVKTRCMENVVLVPKAAVELVGGTTYVNLLTDDGRVKRTAFIAGGSNNNYYWVISGLDEGMNICWE